MQNKFSVWLVVASGFISGMDNPIVAAGGTDSEIQDRIGCTSTEFTDFCDTKELPEACGLWLLYGHFDNSDPEEWSFVADTDWMRLNSEEAVSLAQGRFRPRAPEQEDTDKTRIIGPTKSEFDALERGATAFLGVPREGMDELKDGQEVLAIEGWNHGDEPRADVRRARLLLGQPAMVELSDITDEQIGKLTGQDVTRPALATVRLDEVLDALDSEVRGGFPAGPWLFIPFRKVAL